LTLLRAAILSRWFQLAIRYLWGLALLRLGMDAEKSGIYAAGTVEVLTTVVLPFVDILLHRLRKRDRLGKQTWPLEF
jgi:hypothetical protein